MILGSLPLFKICGRHKSIIYYFDHQFANYTKKFDLSNQIYPLYQLLQMIITDREILKLHLYHPSSSLVISNPSKKLAVVFEISIEDNLNDQTSSIKYFLGFESFQVSPIKGIILPQDSQLIKLKANVTATSQYQNQKNIKKKRLPYELEVAQLKIACSYLLEYNKQKIERQEKANGWGIFGVENIERSQNYKIKVLIETQKTRKTSDELISQLNELKSSKYSHDNPTKLGDTKKNTLVQDFKRHIEPISMKDLDSNIREQKEKSVNFENSKLCEDYNFAKNKMTLSELQKLKSDKISRHNIKQGLPDFPQSNIHIKFPSQKEWKDEAKSKKRVNVEESVVLETFRPVASIYKQRGQKGTNKSIEILFLAIVSAIFVSLGSNFRTIFFSS